MADFSLLSGQINFLGSGCVVSGSVASGAFMGTEFGSGSVMVGSIGSGAVQSGNIASGQVGFRHLANASVQSGSLASGQVSSFHIASGGVQSGNILSGNVNQFSLSSGCVASGHINSGNVITYARLMIDDSRTAAVAISGVIAVALGSGGGTYVPAERQSGLRMPAVGVNITNAGAGAAILVVTDGFVPAASSGTIASGAGGMLWVGSGGLLVNLSGFMGGASSGPGVGSFSGSLIQAVGIAVSGGVFVMPNLTVYLALNSGHYLQNTRVSGTMGPASGFGANVF